MRAPWYGTHRQPTGREGDVRVRGVRAVAPLLATLCFWAVTFPSGPNVTLGPTQAG